MRFKRVGSFSGSLVVHMWNLDVPMSQLFASVMWSLSSSCLHVADTMSAGLRHSPTTRKTRQMLIVPTTEWVKWGICLGQMLISRSMQWPVSVVDFKTSPLLWNCRSTPSLLHPSTIVKPWARLHPRDTRNYIQSGICTPWKVMGQKWANLIDPFEQEGSVTSKKSTE